MPDPIDLTDAADAVLAEAHDSPHGKASRIVVHGERQRVLLVALLAGKELGEHNAPWAATLQVISGRATVHVGDEALQIDAGGLAAIPQARHDLVAVEDTVALLTVALEEPEPARKDH
ncbi:cupin domain-containing protein [Nocardioides terrisoli]|uniref:LuxR family transcriptional regulator n=1 Tax=Nocardioides terrisoli TaxID=3388267 RepID=UPI00287B9F43|nr:LuxR family transcriptional regulator [Nocardioides marmorisolisilvae]